VFIVVYIFLVVLSLFVPAALTVQQILVRFGLNFRCVNLKTTQQ